MNHTRALCHTAYGTHNAVDLKRNGSLLCEGVGGHNRFRRKRAALGAQTRAQMVDTHADDFDGQRYADYAGGRYNNFVGVDGKRPRKQCAHLVCHRHAVRVAGVCVAAVYDNGARLLVSQMRLGYKNGRRLDLILGVNRRRRAGQRAEDCTHVALGGLRNRLVCLNRRLGDCRTRFHRLLNAAVYPVCVKLLGGGYAALYL